MSEGTATPRKRRSGLGLRDGLIIVAALGVMAGFVAWMRSEPAVEPRTLTISAGSLESERALVARALADEASERGLTLKIVESGGSEDALKQLANPASGLDLALVQGALALELTESAEVSQVAALHDEPLHLLVKGAERLEAVKAQGLGALRGRTIDVSRPGTGTYRMALEVLAFGGLSPDDYTATHDRLLDLRNAKPENLPDAVFLVSSLPSAVAELLVQRHGYRVAPLPYAAAFARWRGNGRQSGIVHRQVREGLIPALTYDREPPVPAEPVPTLATRTLLMARSSLDPDLVERLVAVVFESPFRNFDDPALDVTLLNVTPEVDWHPGAVNYMRRNKPIIADDLLDIADKEVSLAAALLGGLFFLVQWIQRRLRQARDQGFETYIMKVAGIERQALALEVAPELDLKALLQLRRDLVGLKAEALERFAAGEIDGEVLMTGFLTQVNDARDHLTRLILHERDNLEEVARRQGLGPEALWQQAAGPAVYDPALGGPITTAVPAPGPEV